MTATHAENLAPHDPKTGFRPVAHSWIVRKGPVHSSKGRLQEESLHNELSEYATRRLKRLLEDEQITPGTARRASVLLGAIAGRGSVFPHMSADDQDLTMLWLAGKATIEVVLSERGQIYVRCTDSRGHETTMGFFSTPPISRLRVQLGQLSRAVAAVNPRWRDIFVS